MLLGGRCCSRSEQILEVRRAFWVLNARHEWTGLLNGRDLRLKQLTDRLEQSQHLGIGISIVEKDQSSTEPGTCEEYLPDSN